MLILATASVEHTCRVALRCVWCSEKRRSAMATSSRSACGSVIQTLLRPLCVPGRSVQHVVFSQRRLTCIACTKLLFLHPVMTEPSTFHHTPGLLMARTQPCTKVPSSWSRIACRNTYPAASHQQIVTVLTYGPMPYQFWMAVRRVC